MKRIISIVVAVIAAGLLIWGAANDLYNRNQLRQLKVNHTRTATVFIGGYGSTPHAYDRMTQSWEHAGIAHRAMTIKVSHDGKMTITGDRKFNDNPTIQVAFEDNRDPRVQIKAFPKIMHWLAANENIKQTNIVTHSMGGVVAYSYLITQHTDAQPTVNKWVAIASPFERLHRKQAFVQQYNKMIDQADHLPANLKIMTVAGDVWGTGSDTQVSVKGVKALRPMVQPYVAHFEEHVLWGSPLTVQHSALRTNPEVVWRIADFLYEK